jgi:hypothetical protein
MCHVCGCVDNNHGGGIISRALLAYNIVRIMRRWMVVVPARGMTQVIILAVGDGGSSQDSLT